MKPTGKSHKHENSAFRYFRILVSQTTTSGGGRVCRFLYQTAPGHLTRYSFLSRKESAKCKPCAHVLLYSTQCQTQCRLWIASAFAHNRKGVRCRALRPSVRSTAWAARGRCRQAEAMPETGWRLRTGVPPRSRVQGPASLPGRAALVVERQLPDCRRRSSAASQDQG